MARTILPDARVSPRFAGISTFCRYPRLEDVLPENRPVDWAIFGVPFDGGVTYRPGARFGPRALREASQYTKRYSMAHAVDVCEKLSLADAGDAPISPYDMPATLDMVADFATSLADEGTRLMAVGGDHSIAYANLLATYTRLGEPAGGLPVIHIDAHLDTTDQVWGCKWGHASPFRRAIEEGLVNPTKMISLGIRGPLNSANDLEYGRKTGVSVITTEELTGEGAPRGRARLADHLKRLGSEPVYVSFDIDVADPAFAPGTGTPAPGGLSSAEVLALIRSFKGIRPAGGDIVELLPDRDVAGITSLLAATAMFEIISLDAAR